MLCKVTIAGYHVLQCRKCNLWKRDNQLIMLKGAALQFGEIRCAYERVTPIVNRSNCFWSGLSHHHGYQWPEVNLKQCKCALYYMILVSVRQPTWLISTEMLWGHLFNQFSFCYIPEMYSRSWLLPYKIHWVKKLRGRCEYELSNVTAEYYLYAHTNWCKGSKQIRYLVNIYAYSSNYLSWL